MARPRAPVENPYGDGRAGERIAEVLAGLEDARALLEKPFNDAREAGERDDGA